jgi:hypothetical protein
MTPEEFSAAVNALAQAECEELNRQGGPFAAVHHAFPHFLLQSYRQRGLTPEETLREINAGAGL